MEVLQIQKIIAYRALFKVLVSTIIDITHGMIYTDSKQEEKESFLTDSIAGKN